MLALLLSFFALLFSWTAAYLLAAPTVYLVHSTSLIDAPVFRVLRPAAKAIGVKSMRRLFFTVILVAFILLVSMLSDTEPASRLLRTYFRNFISFELTQTLMNGPFRNLLLALGVFLLYQAILFTNEFLPRLSALLQSWRHSRFHVIKFKSMELVTPDQITDFLLSLTRYVQSGLTLILTVMGVTYILSFFPGTHGLAFSLIRKMAEIFQGFSAAVLSFMPNLITLIFIILATRFTLKLLRFFYESIQSNKIRTFSLHRDLAEPTYQLLHFFTVTLAVVVAYPYAPGSNSPVFRGITIFAGFLLSLGSTALITNIVSGGVLTYTRGLRIGDRVKIGATTGDVVERTLLVTRILTIKNVVISIPNSVVLNNEIVNYSALTAWEGLILHTTVTIGYDIPWRKVYDLLIRSALATRDIQRRPEPFVLPTSLDSYYVSYELNVYTDRPKRMAVIYSELHQNIQDHFNAAHVEIMPPAYVAYREGNQNTITAVEHNMNAPGHL